MTAIADAPRPPFPYFGGKQRIAARVVDLFPGHGHYVEPYCGGLSVLAAKPRSRMETVNDLDGQLMRFWRVLRDRPDDLARVCALTPHARVEHEESRDRDVDDELEAARRVWVAVGQGRGGQMVRTGWRHFVAPRQHSMGMPGYLDAYVDRMATMAERLHNVSLECRPALDVIASYGRDRDVLLYVDPPYLGTTRGHAHSYQHEMRSVADHTDLAGALHQSTAAVILSGYHSRLYDELYADWHVTELRATTQQGNHTAGSTQGRTEVLWSNRPLAGQQVLA